MSSTDNQRITKSEQNAEFRFDAARVHNTLMANPEHVNILKKKGIGADNRAIPWLPAAASPRR
jgi:hypothetical protein